MAGAGVFKGSRVVLLPPVDPVPASGFLRVGSASAARPLIDAATGTSCTRPAAPQRPAGPDPGRSGRNLALPVRAQRAVGCVHSRPVAPTPNPGGVPDRFWTPTVVESTHVLELLEWRRRVETVEPGPELVGVLDGRPDVLAGRRATVDDTAAGVWSHAAAVLDGVTARRRQLAAMAADEARDLALLRAEYPGVDQFLPAELALALGIPEVEAQNLLDRAHRLVTVLPATLAALAAGSIHPQAADAVVNATATADSTVAARVEAAVLPTAAGRTYRQVFAACSYRLATFDAPALRRRHRQAVADRRLTRRALTDGMARLSATGTAGQIAAVWEALTLLADTAATADDPRDTGNRRVDALVDLCTYAADRTLNGDLTPATSHDPGSLRPRPGPLRRRAPRPSVHVVMPLSTLLGGDQPGLLTGHGSIPADHARAIAADADLRRLVCDPLTGQVLDYGHTVYRPPAALARLIKTRDRTCVFPGCEQPAARCDVDHTIPATPDPATGTPTQGTTCYCNLNALCRHHHLTKDGIGGFTLTRNADGSHTWTTTLGRTTTRGPTDTLGAGDHTLNRQPTLRQLDDLRRDREQDAWQRDLARYRLLSDHDVPAATCAQPNGASEVTDRSAVVDRLGPAWVDNLPDDPPF